MPLFLRLPAFCTLAACLSLSGGVLALATDAIAAQTPTKPADAEKEAAKKTAAETKTAKAEAKLPPKKQLTPEQTALRDRIRETLAGHWKQPFNTRESSPGDILKFCRAFGCQTEIYHGDDEQRINGVTALCWDLPCGGRQLLFVDDGHIAARVGYGLQERPSEFLAVLALSCVPSDYPLCAGKAVRTVADLVEHEKLTCRAGTDLSRKLIGLSYYVEQDAWKNNLGEPWSLRRVIREELSRASLSGQQEVSRLLGLSCAVARCEKRKLPIEGEFASAKTFVDEYQDYVFRTQGADGSWALRPAPGQYVSRDFSSQLLATGLVAEWLAVSLPESRLEGAAMVKAIDFLDSALNGQRQQWNLPSLGSRDLDATTSALHALSLYDKRVFKPADEEKPAAEPKDKDAKPAVEGQ